MAAFASVEYRCSDLHWCYLQQTVHFFQSDPHAVIPNKLASLVSTARSPIILWRLWSYKPSHKHDSNKHQSKAFVICDHKSDETRSVTHVNKAYLVWLMFRVLSNQHYQHRANQKLRSWANAVLQNCGVCGQAFPSFPSPPPSFPFTFFGSPPNFLDELVRKRAAMRANCRALQSVVESMLLKILVPSAQQENLHVLTVFE